MAPVYCLRFTIHPKRSKPATTIPITSGATSLDELDWLSRIGVAVAPGSVGVNFWVGVGVIEICVNVGVTLGRTGIGVIVAGGVTRRSSR